ncbi:MAG: ADP-forming succinate--CoA ligase subunit beta [Candidatus Omnitrophota bacterium]|nr:ADP-forming succinate--CoA ligase subunit beta [Candidatus Omnitrophota bacterium]
MKIHEYQAKGILNSQGISVPEGMVVDNTKAGQKAAQSMGFPLAVKAQIHAGGRGKAGAIRIVADMEELKKGLDDILGMAIKGLTVKKILIEKAVKIRKQFYLGIIADRARQSNVIIVSGEGGMDIEEIAKLYPEKIKRVSLKSPDKLEDENISGLMSFLGLAGEIRESFAKIVRGFFSAYIKADAQLAEINPLVLTEADQLIACDAKIIIDDNALFRHPELELFKEEAEDNELEKEAHRRNLAYVKISGDIGIIGNGAGLVMATMDEVKRAGGSPANFLDIGGGAKREVMQNALEIIYMDKEVRGIFINIFGGITRCDEVARGIIQVLEKTPSSLPIVLRLAGTQCEEGRRLLGNSNLITAEGMEEGANRIVSLVKSR